MEACAGFVRHQNHSAIKWRPIGQAADELEHAERVVKERFLVVWINQNSFQIVANDIDRAIVVGKEPGRFGHAAGSATLEGRLTCAAEARQAGESAAQSKSAAAPIEHRVVKESGSTSDMTAAHERRGVVEAKQVSGNQAATQDEPTRITGGEIPSDAAARHGAYRSYVDIDRTVDAGAGQAQGTTFGSNDAIDHASQQIDRGIRPETEYAAANT